MIAYVTGNADPIYGSAAHAAMVRQMFRIFPDVRVHNDPYPIQFGSGDWITVVTRTTGTFTGQMAGPTARGSPRPEKRSTSSSARPPSGRATSSSSSPPSATPHCRPADRTRLAPSVTAGSRQPIHAQDGEAPQIIAVSSAAPCRPGRVPPCWRSAPNVSTVAHPAPPAGQRPRDKREGSGTGDEPDRRAWHRDR